MLSSIDTVVGYRHYRLADTAPLPAQTFLRYMYKSKTQIDGLYPTLGVIYVFVTI